MNRIQFVYHSLSDTFAPLRGATIGYYTSVFDSLKSIFVILVIDILYYTRENIKVVYLTGLLSFLIYCQHLGKKGVNF